MSLQKMSIRKKRSPYRISDLSTRSDPNFTKHVGKVPKMEESSHISCIRYGLCKGNPIPRIAEYKVQGTLHFIPETLGP